MSPAKHIAVGVAGGAVISIISGNIPLGIGFLMGSWMIDLDHVWPYQLATKFKRLFAAKEFFQWNDQRGREFSERPYLHLPFLHTLEVMIFLFVAMLYVSNPLLFTMLYGLWFGFLVHLILDEFAMYDEYFSKIGWQYLKRSHSIIEYLIRRFILHEKVYEELFQN